MTSKKDEITCINLPKPLRDRLAQEGKKRDTYADIITRMLDDVRSCKMPNGQDPEENDE